MSTSLAAIERVAAKPRARAHAGDVMPAALLLIALAALVGYSLHEVIETSGRLPGRDAGNLYVWEQYTRAVLAKGRLPHWNPYHFTGTPHMADPQTTVFYPPALLLRWLPVPLFLGWMAALHVWIGGAGTLFLCRVIGLKWAAAAAAAIAVTFGGSVGAWLHNGHLLLIYGTAWLPWALALAIISVRRPGLLPHPALVLVLVLQFLAGYLQGSLYVGGVVCLYFLYSAVVPDRNATRAGHPVAKLLVVAALAAALSAFQLLPTMRLLAEAGRTQGLSFEDAAESGWHVADLATVLFPFRNVAASPTHRYIGDRVAYVGWLLALLVPFAFAGGTHRRLAIFLAALSGGAVALALAYELPLFALHHTLFPGLRVPGRALFVATLGLAVLGAIGLEQFAAIARARAWLRLIRVAAVSGALVLAASATLFGASSPNVAPAHLWPWLPLLAVSGLCAVAAAAARGFVCSGLVFAVAAVGVDVAAFFSGAIATVPIDPEHVIRRWVGPPETGRAVTVCEHILGAGELSQAGRPSVDGMAGLYLADYAKWAYIANMGDPPPGDSDFRRLGSDEELPVRDDLLAFANVTTVYACEPLDRPELRLVSYTPPIYTYRSSNAWPRAWWTCEGEEVTRAAAIARIVEGRYDGARELRPVPSIQVRWRAGLSDAERRLLEQRYGLTDGAQVSGQTWRYVFADGSPAGGLAIIQERAVEDTAGLDRSTGAVLAPWQAAHDDGDEPRGLLTNTISCDARGVVQILAQDRQDGYVRLGVTAPRPGLVVLSEPYYPERQAFVDGRPAPALKANIAFTAVRVPAGTHRVELRLVPRSFHLGVVVSAITALVLVACWWKR